MSPHYAHGCSGMGLLSQLRRVPRCCWRPGRCGDGWSIRRRAPGPPRWPWSPASPPARSVLRAGLRSLLGKRRIGCGIALSRPSPLAFSTPGDRVRSGCAGSCAALWLAVVWFLLPPDIRKEASRGVLLSWLVGLELAGLLYWSLLALTARRLPGVMLPLILLIVSVGSVLVLHCGHISKLTLLATVLAAALLPILARSAWRPPLAMATAPVMTLLLGMWLRSYFYDFQPPTLSSLLLLAAAALAGVLALLPGIRMLGLWRRCLICVLTTFVLVVWAVLLAHSVRNNSEDELLRSRSLQRIATINPQLR